MHRAVVLAANGFPAPNPRVGCVIVKDGEIVGEGWHDYAGGDHAEAMALKAAGDRAVGADLYCTLEPCDHHGRTPPCSQAILRAKIARVFYAVADPNQKASGGGKALVAGGVVVSEGLLKEEAEAVNEVFLTAQRRSRTYVIGKSAQTKDGFIARVDGTSKWITSEDSRLQGHRLRAEMGGVLVGRGTVQTDDPMLTARIPGVVNQPVRIVLDPHGATSPLSNVFADGRVIRYVAPGNDGQPYDVVAQQGEDGFDLKAILVDLFARGVIGVLVEGGGETLASFMRAGLLDRLEVFVAEESFGAGRPWLGSSPPELAMRQVAERDSGSDVWRTYRP